MASIHLFVLVVLLAGCSGPSSTDRQDDGLHKAPPTAAGQPVAPAAEEALERPVDPDARLQRAAPGTPRGPDRADIDASALPADAADFLIGPALRGTLRDGETGEPIGDCTVSEHGADGASVRTGADGVFLLSLKDERRPAVLAVCDGYVPTLQVADDQSRLYFDGEFKIEMFERAEEEAASMADFGRPWDPSKAVVWLNFQPQGLPVGVSGVLDAKGSPSWVYGIGDKPAKGTTFGSEPGVGEIVYPGVTPAASYGVTVTAEAPLECFGPDAIPALADTATRAYYFCTRPGEAPRTSKDN